MHTKAFFNCRSLRPWAQLDEFSSLHNILPQDWAGSLVSCRSTEACERHEDRPKDFLSPITSGVTEPRTEVIILLSLNTFLPFWTHFLADNYDFVTFFNCYKQITVLQRDNQKTFVDWCFCLLKTHQRDIHWIHSRSYHFNSEETFTVMVNELQQ